MAIIAGMENSNKREDMLYKLRNTSKYNIEKTMKYTAISNKGR
jgi:hypothetical protein